MKLILIVPIWLLMLGCTKTNNQDQTANDTTKIVEQILTDVDSPGTISQSSVEEYGQADYYLVNLSLDTSEVQIIDRSCAILIEATAAQEMAMQKQQHAELEQAKVEWEKQPHDTSERFDDESYSTDDGMFYQWQAQNTLAELKIDTITVRKKGYVKLIDKSKKEWILDIRSNMTPEWTIILFNVNKEPKVIGAIDVTKELLTQYFLLN